MLVTKSNEPKKFEELSFDDLGELFFSAVLLTKLPQASDDALVTLELGLTDIFARSALADVTEETTVSARDADHIQRSLSTFMDVIFGLEESIVPETRTAKSLGEFFGTKIERCLSFLRDGDGADTQPAIEAYTRASIDALGVPVFNVSVRRQKFIDAFNVNVSNFLNFQESMHGILSASTEVAYPAVAISKQLDFMRMLLDARSSATGEEAFSFLLSEANFRRILLSFEGLGGEGVMLSPLSHGASAKVDLPLVLASKGELDIENIKIVSPICNVDDIDVQFSIRRPAVKNILGATYLSLPPGQRQLMSETELKVYEDMARQLQANLAFMGKPALEASFVQLACWAIRQIAYCLQEPSFLKIPALKWMESNTENGYKRMEDDFFLPFLYERLRDRFGQLASKKPERFGGNVDILFGGFPSNLRFGAGDHAL